jgi:hypothetical protein
MATLKEWLAFLLFFIVLMWFSITGNVFLAGVMLILAGVGIYLDAKNRGIGPASGEKQSLGELRTWTPATWGILVFLFFIIFMPVYLWKRDSLMREG